eukprot:c9553_g1_i2.p1 GENE.c9553_g1_i2~~c9553_g1_i2.p1  ORF type:complete len:166 (-),score=36.53 c9553_g1_i2:5-502(-)
MRRFFKAVSTAKLAGTSTPTFSHLGVTKENNIDCYVISTCGLPTSARGIAYDPVLKIMAVTQTTGFVKIYGTAGVEDSVCVQQNTDITFASFAAGKGVLVCVTQANKVAVVSLATRKLLAEWDVPVKVTCAVLTPSGDILLLGCVDGSVRIFDVRTKCDCVSWPQ